MEQANFLSNVAVFSHLDVSDLGFLGSKLRRRTFQKGEVLFHQDDPGDRLHFVADGLVKISIVSPDGRENYIALLMAGDCVGEMSVMDGGLRSATAVAMEPTETMTLSREDFLAFLNDHTQVAVQIITLLVRRLRAMDKLVGDMVFLDVPTRVAKKLLELMGTYGDIRDDAGNFAVPLGQEELSRLVGSSRETVSRALTTYRRMGLLTTSPEDQYHRRGRATEDGHHLVSRREKHVRPDVVSQPFHI